MAIRGGDAKSVNALLQGRAAASIYVQGPTPGSLECTLPMTVHAPGRYDSANVLELADVSKEILDSLDSGILFHLVTHTLTHVHSSFLHVAALVAHLEDYTKADVKSNAFKTSASTSKGTARSGTLAPPATAVAPFDHFPATLAVGDIVRRGKNWKWNDQVSRC